MTDPTDRPYSDMDDDRRMTDAERAEAADDRSMNDPADPGRSGTEWTKGDDDLQTRGTPADAMTDRGTTADAMPDRGTTDDAMTDGGTTADAMTDRGTTDDVMADRGTPADEPLVPQEAAVDYRTRWEVIQQGFVDDPRNAVTEADKLVDDVLKRLSESFESQHQDLEKQWSDGQPETEDLRTALQKYRAFFQRLLAL